MFYSVKYIQDRAPYADIPGQPDQRPRNESAANGDSQDAPQASATQQRASSPEPHTSAVFNVKLREMAQDLVLREQQIEYLINSLPGMGNSEADQERRMRELELELKEADAERARAETVREGLEQGLGKVIMAGRRPG